MSTADVAADAGAYEARSLFVRKATGLVRGWAVRDAFMYSVFAINLVTLGFYIFSFGPLRPDREPVLGGDPVVAQAGDLQRLADRPVQGARHPADPVRRGDVRAHP